MTHQEQMRIPMSAPSWVRKTGIGRRYHALLDLAYTSYHRIPYRELYPHFLVIGAQKAGTTSLHHYLNQHPDIFMTAFKETNLMLEDSPVLGGYAQVDPEIYGNSNRDKRRKLSDDQILRKMLRGYRGERLIGDASPFYSCLPLVGAEVPRKAVRVRPEMRIIYTLRHPIERIASNYKHDLLLFKEKPTMQQWIQRYEHPVCGSAYASQLAKYLEVFPLERVHLLRLEDLTSDASKELDRIFHFLGVSATETVDTSSYYRASAIPLKVTDKPSKPLQVPSEVYERVIDRLQDEVEKLEGITGRTFGWDLSRDYCVQAGSSRDE